VFQALKSLLLVTLITTITLLFLTLSAEAADYTSSQTGNWNDAATRGGGGTPVTVEFLLVPVLFSRVVLTPHQASTRAGRGGTALVPPFFSTRYQKHRKEEQRVTR